MIFDKHLFLVSGLLLCLLGFCTVGLLFAADRPNKTDEPSFVPGKEVRVDIDNKRIGGDHFTVYIPSDYTDEHDWPVIFLYHGANGKPTTWPLRQVTAERGFIIIGMGYVEHSTGKTTRGEYVNYIKRERRSVLEVKRYVSRHLRVDKKRMFITGFSMGGWHTSIMLESSAKVWAGAAILCAGRSRNASLIATAAGRAALYGKPIYIGAGEKDMNLAAAKKAATYYERVGAKVTFEEHKGLGHTIDPNSETLRDWLLTNSSTKDTKSDQSDVETKAADIVE
ncbi:MAG: alpha/beta hydrolase-fold protein [Planctomycetota bacterium]|jgi:poly(3-hydroxybutyrate) depolymerase